LFSRTAVAALARVTGALGAGLAAVTALALSWRATLAAGGFLLSRAAVAALARVASALRASLAAVAALALTWRAALTAGGCSFSSAAAFGVSTIATLSLGAAFSWTMLAALAIIWRTNTLASGLATRATGTVVPAVAAGAIAPVFTRLAPDAAWSTIAI